jgi:hypothetical protein
MSSTSLWMILQPQLSHHCRNHFLVATIPKILPTTVTTILAVANPPALSPSSLITKKESALGSPVYLGETF